MSQQSMPKERLKRMDMRITYGCENKGTLRGRKRGTQKKLQRVSTTSSTRREAKMYQIHHHLLFLFSTIAISFLFPLPSAADVGTAAYYNAPYLPTKCFESDPTQFPAGNLFAAAGEGIWDNNAACGRQYQVVCLSSKASGGCIPDVTIRVKIVDRAATLSSTPSAGGTTMVLSSEAFRRIANPSAGPQINIDFAQV